MRRAANMIVCAALAAVVLAGFLAGFVGLGGGPFAPRANAQVPSEVEFPDAMLWPLFYFGADVSSVDADTDVPVYASNSALNRERKPKIKVVTLIDAGPCKAKVMIAIHDTIGASMEDAQKIVESVPRTVKKCSSSKEAEEIKESLEAVGATVIIL